MNHKFQAPTTAIEKAMSQLKSYGLVHPEALFNFEAVENLRREVTYRDEDFLYQLARTSAEEEIVDDALNYLKSLQLVSPDAIYDHRSFEHFRKEIKQNFIGTWTSITPVME